MELLVHLAVLSLELYGFAIIAWLILTTLAAFNIVNRQQRAVMLATYYLNRVCGPAIRRVRRHMPDTGQLDLSPIVLLLLINFAQDTVVLLAMGKNPMIALVALGMALLQFIIYLLIAQMVLSLLITFGIVNRFQPVVSALGFALERLCGPLLAPVQRVLPPIGGIDLAPLLFIALLGVVQDALMRLMLSL